MYLTKCGADVSRIFGDLRILHQYQCETTSMCFWRPAEVAGDELFYRDISSRWPSYYRTNRWEYAIARGHIQAGSQVLEVGCGRGYFLNSLEHFVSGGVGLELNRSAIEAKVTKFTMQQALIENFAVENPQQFGAVCSFQVLEHVVDPAEFIRNCVACLKPGGVLILSTPNYDYVAHRRHEDAFDLPPHHLNHFTSSVYEKIAALFGLEVIDIIREQVAIPSVSLPIRGHEPYLQRIIMSLINLLLRRFGSKQNDGHTLVAILRRPHSQPAIRNLPCSTTLE
jgi:SAM-dependent methyltransferase